MNIIAHRCGTDLYPELTIQAAEHSLTLGADYIEMDVRFTADNVPVIVHDADAMKLFGEDKNISEISATEFLSFRHVGHRQYCSHTLDDMFDTLKAPILLHCKVSGQYIDEILRCICNNKYEDRAIMGLTQYEDAKRVKGFNPNIQTLAFMPSMDQCDAFINAGFDIIRLWEGWVTPEAIEKIHASQRKVWIMARGSENNITGYTTKENMKALFDLGVDGILIDEVKWAKQILNSIK